jgi:hypothetical protein
MMMSNKDCTVPEAMRQAQAMASLTRSRGEAIAKRVNTEVGYGDPGGTMCCLGHSPSRSRTFSAFTHQISRAVMDLFEKHMLDEGERDDITPVTRSHSSLRAEVPSSEMPMF